MNTFCKHYQNSIKLSYHRLGHILLDGLIWPFQQPERVIVNAYRHRSHPFQSGCLAMNELPRSGVE
jgi:hypothetical protein